MSTWEYDIGLVTARDPCPLKLRLPHLGASGTAASRTSELPAPLGSSAPLRSSVVEMASPSPQSKGRFGAPSLGSNVDAGRALKLAQRVEQTLKTVKYPEPKILDPHTLLVSPQNRDGAPPNLQYVHFGILRSLAKSGFDRSRPAVGICIEARSSEAKQRLLEYNRRFSTGVPLMPPIHAERVLYGTLAGTHLNLALRILKAGTSSPACDVSGIMGEAEGTSLREVVEEGHKWWVLPEETPLEQQVEVSLWRNMDQNENQALHEIEVLRNIAQTCNELSLVSKSIALGEIVARALRRSPAKISDLSLQNLAKYYLAHLGDKTVHLAKELMEFHAARVNPRDLVTASNFFKNITDELKSLPHLRHYLTLAQYTSENSKQSAGQPATANFIETATITNLGKKRDLVQALEHRLKAGRDRFLPLLEAELTEPLARLEFADLGIAWVRCVLAKPIGAEWAKKMPTGGLTDEKAADLEALWGLWVDGRHPNLELSRRACLEVKKDGTKKSRSEDLQELIDLGGLAEAEDKTEEAAANASVASASGSLKPGDHVTVSRRFTWTIPLENNEKFRHDVTVGTQGIVEGFADENHRAVLLAIEMRLPGPSGPVVRKVTEKAFPRNLQKTSDWEAQSLAARAATEPAADEGESAGAAGGENKKRPSKLPKALSFLEGGEETAGDILIEPKWESLVDPSELTHSFWAIKGKAGVLAGALLENIPPLTAKDLAIIHRPLRDGAYRTEVWTLRKFAARELVIPVVSLELRDCLWTNKLFAFLGLPACGQGSHPEGKKVAFDGRGKSRISSKGTLEQEERKGLLCWVIERSKEPKETNLSFDSVTGDLAVNLSLPIVGGKRRKVTHKIASELLPSLPIIVNMRALAAHTRLFVPAGTVPARAPRAPPAAEAGG